LALFAFEAPAFRINSPWLLRSFRSDTERSPRYASSLHRHAAAGAAVSEAPSRLCPAPPLASRNRWHNAPRRGRSDHPSAWPV